MAEGLGIERAGQQAVLYASATVAQLLIQVATLVYVARALGPANYGVYGLSQNPALFLSLFTDFGIDAAVLRFASLYASRGEECRLAGLLKRALLVKAVLALAAAAPLLLAPEELGRALSNREGLGPYVALTAAVLAPQVVLNDALSFMVGLGMAAERSALYVAQPAVRLALIAAMFSWMGPGVWPALAGSALSYAVSAALSIYWLRGWLSKRGCPAEMREVVSYALAVFSGGLAGAIVSRLQAYLLGLATSGMGEHGNALAGNFNAAFYLSGALSAVFGALATPLLPLFVYQWQRRGDAEALSELVAPVSAVLSAVTVPLSVFSILYAGEVLRAVYGPGYAAAPALYLCMAPSLLAWPLSAVASSAVMALGDKKAMLASSAATLASGVALYVPLSRVLGVPGIALASGLYGLPALAVQATALKRRGVGLGLKPYAVSLAVAAAAAWMSLPVSSRLGTALARLAAGLLVSSVAYGAGAAAAGLLGEAEISLAERLSRGVPVLGQAVRLYLRLYERARRVFGR